MSVHETSNKATIRRSCDAVNTGDTELVPNMIDALVEPERAGAHAIADRGDRSAIG